MVRNYIRKTNRQQWDKKLMVEAINAIAKGEISFNLAAKKYSIPKSTIIRYYHKTRGKVINFNEFKLGAHKTVFSEEQESKLKQYIKDVNLSLCELTPLELRKIAFQYAEMNGISHNFNRKKQLAGYEWYRSFTKRNESPDKSSTDEVESQASLQPLCGLNVSHNVEEFFDLLTDLQQFYKFPANRIYNVHDKGIISIPNLTSKIISISDQPISITDIITVISCCNAVGNFIPPLMVYPAKEEDPEFIEVCPPGTKIVCNSVGTIQHDTFYPTWFDHFVNHVQPRKRDPILMLLDGQELHIKNMEFIEKAKEYNIHILSIPVTSSDKLYPLELKFMVDLKKYYNEVQNKWKEENQGQMIDSKCIAKIFSLAYKEAAVPEGAIHAFKECGIYPLNRYVLADEHNAPIVTPLIEELPTNISVSTENKNDESSLGPQTNNFEISITGSSGSNNSLDNSEDFNDLVFDSLTKNQEES